MIVFHDNESLRGSSRDTGGDRVLVPTMGALHEGHATLIRRGVEIARERGLAGGCVVSIFVNPTQFNEKSDYERYPRTLEADIALCERAGANAVYAPKVHDVYPPESPPPMPAIPAVAAKPGLEDAHRPGHFAGVCQVVARLFDLVQPVMAIFGEKDWQQLQVVRAIVESSAGRGLSSPREVKFPGRGLSSPREVKFPGRGLSSPRKVEIIGIPTIREPDGMAMSSRNRFLSREDRSRVAMIFRALCESHAASTPEGAERIMRRVLAEASIEPEYAVVRDACTLMPVEFSTTDDRPAGRLSHSQPAFRALIAARVGSVRLIDNSDWGGGLCSSAWSSRGVMS